MRRGIYPPRYRSVTDLLWSASAAKKVGSVITYFANLYDPHPLLCITFQLSLSRKVSVSRQQAEGNPILCDTLSLFCTPLYVHFSENLIAHVAAEHLSFSRRRKSNSVWHTFQSCGEEGLYTNMSFTTKAQRVLRFFDVFTQPCTSSQISSVFR